MGFHTKVRVSLAPGLRHPERPCPAAGFFHASKMRPVITSTGGILRKAQPVSVACLRQEDSVDGRPIRAAKTGSAEEGGQSLTGAQQ